MRPVFGYLGLLTILITIDSTDALEHAECSADKLVSTLQHIQSVLREPDVPPSAWVPLEAILKDLARVQPQGGSNHPEQEVIDALLRYCTDRINQLKQDFWGEPSGKLEMA